MMYNLERQNCVMHKNSNENCLRFLRDKTRIVIENVKFTYFDMLE